MNAWQPPDPEALRRAFKDSEWKAQLAAVAHLGPAELERVAAHPGAPDWKVTEHPGAFGSTDGRGSWRASAWSSPWAESLFPGPGFLQQELRSQFSELVAAHGRQGGPQDLRDLIAFAGAFTPANLPTSMDVERWSLNRRIILFALAKALRSTSGSAVEHGGTGG